MSDPTTICDACGREIVWLLDPQGKSKIKEQTIFYLPETIPGDIRSIPGIFDPKKKVPALHERVRTHTKCVPWAHERGLLVDKYILASPADYPIRPGVFAMKWPDSDTGPLVFDEVQMSKTEDLAQWESLKTFTKVSGEYMRRLWAARGALDPGRRWSLVNDDRILPSEKAKVIAIPAAATDSFTRGDIARATKRILRGDHGE
jgi:hypothetical protein